jgi:hypothetical protein
VEPVHIGTKDTVAAGATLQLFKRKKNVVNPHICKRKEQASTMPVVSKMWFKETGDIPLQIVQLVRVPLIFYIYFTDTLPSIIESGGVP